MKISHGMFENHQIMIQPLGAIYKRLNSLNLPILDFGNEQTSTIEWLWIQIWESNLHHYIWKNMGLVWDQLVLVMKN